MVGEMDGIIDDKKSQRSVKRKVYIKYFLSLPLNERAYTFHFSGLQPEFVEH
jgi:hypothetical protein